MCIQRRESTHSALAHQQAEEDSKSETLFTSATVSCLVGGSGLRVPSEALGKLHINGKNADWKTKLLCHLTLQLQVCKYVFIGFPMEDIFSLNLHGFIDILGQ